MMCMKSPSPMQALCQCIYGQHVSQNLLGFSLCSLEAKHSVKGIAEMTLKLTNDLHGALQLCATSSHTRECTHWGWTYRSAFSRICYGLTVHVDLLTGFLVASGNATEMQNHTCLYNCFEQTILLIYTHCCELMKSVGNNASWSLLFMKVMV